VLAKKEKIIAVGGFTTIKIFRMLRIIICG
jgi:hypothetical protein